MIVQWQALWIILEGKEAGIDWVIEIWNNYADTNSLSFYSETNGVSFCRSYLMFPITPDWLFLLIKMLSNYLSLTCN